MIKTASEPAKDLQAHGPGDTVLRREWMDLKSLQAYADISERTLRHWIRDPLSPLPASKVGGKLLVRRQDFDAYIESHRVNPLDLATINRTVDEILNGGK